MKYLFAYVLAIALTKNRGMIMNSINDKVLALDMKNLSQAELDWLHDLYALAQKVRNAEFYKTQGIDGKRKTIQTGEVK